MVEAGEVDPRGGKESGREGEGKRISLLTLHEPPMSMPPCELLVLLLLPMSIPDMS